jgi:hypothetical protein
LNDRSSLTASENFEQAVVEQTLPVAAAASQTVSLPSPPRPPPRPRPTTAKPSPKPAPLALPPPEAAVWTREIAEPTRLPPMHLPFQSPETSRLGPRLTLLQTRIPDDDPYSVEEPLEKVKSSRKGYKVRVRVVKD